MNKNTYKESSHFSPKSILTVLGIFCIFAMIAVYAMNQGKLSYRSIHSTTTVWYENTTASFNSDKVEEHGTCFTIASNSCAKDVFIPSKTTGELLSFTGHKPTCITLGACCDPNSRSACSSECNGTQTNDCGTTQACGGCNSPQTCNAGSCTCPATNTCQNTTCANAVNHPWQPNPPTTCTVGACTWNGNKTCSIYELWCGSPSSTDPCPRTQTHTENYCEVYSCQADNSYMCFITWSPGAWVSHVGWAVDSNWHFIHTLCY